MINEQLKQLFEETFSPNQKISYDLDIKVGDIPEWDSFGNFNFLLSIEEKFNIRFSVEEMSELKSLATISEVIEKRINKK